MIESNKQKAKTAKEMEEDLRPYLEKRQEEAKGKKDPRKALNFDPKPTVQTETNFYRAGGEFEEIDSVGFSSEHDS